MKKILNIIKKTGIVMGIIVIWALLISLLNYINLISSKVSFVLNVVFIGLMIFFLSYKKASQSEKNGYLVGLKYGGIFVITFFILSLILFQISINIPLLLYYIIMICISILGGMFGINKKAPNKK